jgi:hypothetical protein
MLELSLHSLGLRRIPQRTGHYWSHTNAVLKLNLSIIEQHVLQVEGSFIRFHIKPISRDINPLTN